MATKWTYIKFKFSEEVRLKIREEALAELRAMEERDRKPEDVAIAAERSPFERPI